MRPYGARAELQLAAGIPAGSFPADGDAKQPESARYDWPVLWPLRPAPARLRCQATSRTNPLATSRTNPLG